VQDGQPIDPHPVLTKIAFEGRDLHRSRMNVYEVAAGHPHSSTDRPWFVVQLKPNADAIAKRNLLRQGIEIFAPFEVVTARKAQKLVQTSRPLFPGYLFVTFDAAAIRWRTVNSTMGVSRLVRFAEDRPLQMPHHAMSGLIHRCDADGQLLPPRFLQAGDVVRVAGGPLANFIGTVEQLAPDQRIWILLDILGKSTRVAIKSADLRLAS
jgi:transcriptional antiterminator RfaH